MFDPKLKEALGRVQKPGRYTGGEPGSIYKEKDKVDVRFAFCFPDTYEVGMSFLGEKILYELLNSHENWWCERAFMPWLENDLWLRRHGTKYNGAPYIVQRAGEAVYSEAGKAQIKEQIAYYMENARQIREGLIAAGYQAFGGVNSPYVWLKTPDNLTSWEFFDKLLNEAQVVGTPGSGFGASGEGYFRLTGFGTHENTKEAIKRIQALKTK